jgi:predicted Holliday junction resolvase-like endonuclease
LTPRQTGQLAVGRNITLTLTCGGIIIVIIIVVIIIIIIIIIIVVVVVVVDCTIPLRRNNRNFNTPYKRYSAGDYVLLYNTQLTCDRSALYIETAVDAAVDRLNAAVAQAINLAVPSGCVTKHKIPYLVL